MFCFFLKLQSAAIIHGDITFSMKKIIYHPQNPLSQITTTEIVDVLLLLTLFQLSK